MLKNHRGQPDKGEKRVWRPLRGPVFGQTSFPYSGEVKEIEKGIDKTTDIPKSNQESVRLHDFGGRTAVQQEIFSLHRVRAK